jgi:hypothetical protein
LEPTGRQSLPSKKATLSARGSPFAFWNDPVAKSAEPSLVSALMNVVVENQPFVPAVSAPRALHAEPFQLATWSAWGMPATSLASVPMKTSVPTAVRLRVIPVTAPDPGPGPDPIACHPPPVSLRAT